MASLHVTDASPGEAVASGSLALDLGKLTTSKLRIYSDSTLSNLKVYVKDVAYNPGSVVDVAQGDTLRFTGIAPSTYNTPAFVNLLLEGVKFFSFVVLTQTDPATSSVKASLVNKPEPDFLIGYVPTAQDNKVIKVASSTNIAQSVNLIPRETALEGTRGDGKPYLFVADYVNNRVHRFDPELMSVVESIAINKPHGVGHTPTATYFDNTVSHTLISSPSDNKVYVFDGDQHTLKTSVTTGAGPHGVCGEIDKVEGTYGFWVACFAVNRVEHWKFNGTTLARDFYYDLAANSGPYAIATDDVGNAIVTCLKSDKVARCPAGGTGTVTYASVGADPWDVYINGDFAYVSCAGSNDVYAVTLPNLTASKLRIKQQNVSSAAVANGYLFAGSYDIGTFKRYTMSSGQTAASPAPIECDRLFRGVVPSDTGEEVFAVSMYQDALSCMTVPDTTPDNVQLTNQDGLFINQSVASNSVTVSGVATSARFTVHTMAGGTITPHLVKNAANVGQTTTAVDNDEISIGFTTPSSYSLAPIIEIPLVYDGGLTLWTVELKAGVQKRVAGWIQGG